MKKTAKLTSASLIERSDRVLMNTYARFPVAFVRGEGARLWDPEGKEYLDFFSGLAVLNLGHCHPEIVSAVRAQSGLLFHTSNLFYTEPPVRLAEALVEHSFADKVFFCNSGAEANEGAVKLARIYARNRRKDERVGVVTMENSFHGRTLGMISATGQEKVKVGFAPLLEGFQTARFNDLASVTAAASGWAGAVLLEPIQGEGGVFPATPEFITGVRKLCDREGMLLIFDEVQVGIGRTGELFAYQHYGVEPDILTLAKAVGGGLPLGAVLATNAVASAFTPGTHATTFGGNAVATAAGEAVLNVILTGKILENCRRQGKALRSALEKFARKYAGIREIRGRGLIVGMELEDGEKGQRLIRRALDSGLILNLAHGNVVRFLPPLNLTTAELARGLKILEKLLAEILGARDPRGK
ncbi:MAG: aspartate aminotransferase family protein [Proteobacteria bacterium]|nr:aspartate aminotransferase family protein [Pseudomonadota bacterium]